MSMFLWRRAAAACLAAAGVLVLAAPAAAAPAAAPPTSLDERLFLYNSEGQAPAAPGSSVTFVMSTDAPQEDVPQHRTVVLELPDGVTFRSADNPNSAGPCVPDAAGTTVTCTTGEPVDQKPATDGAWWVTTDFADELPPGEFVTAKATLTTEIPDPDPANNVSTWDVFVTTGGDMSVSISAPEGPWRVGATFDAVISVHNFGPYRSGGELVSGVYPLSLRYTGWPEGCGADPGTMYCPLPVIEAGATFTFTVHFKVTGYDDGKISITPKLYPVAPDTDAGNNKAAYRADILKPSPSPSPSPTATGDSGGGAGGEPTLPITGAPAAPLALAGLSLLAAGAGALLLTRRRLRRS